MRNGESARAQKLRPLLGRVDIAWIVLAATLGGGLFTLLDPAIGRAGAGILIVIMLNGLLGLVTAVRYAQLSSVLPDVGGGQQWIRRGMGSHWGHMSGWVSWFAHSVACGVYAKSLGFYMYQFFFVYLNFKVPGPQDSWENGIAGSIIVAVALVNYLGVRFTGQVNKWGGIAVLLILGVFVFLGLLTGSRNLEASAANFNGFFSSIAIVGVLHAMGIFYLAFQGPETGGQTGEEVRNPRRDIGWGIIVGYIAVWLVILIVTFVALFGVHGEEPSSVILGKASDGALVSASHYFLGGTILYPLLLVGGIVVAAIALNATMYSSSHAFLALARNQSIPQGLDRISPRFGTPSFGIGISTALILFMALRFPLHDIAAVADVLFIALFAILHWAFVDLRRREEVLKNVKLYIPFSSKLCPYVYPYGIVLIYGILILFLWDVSPTGVLIGGGWLAAGYILYNRYTQVEEFKEVDARIIHSFLERRGVASAFKVHCPFPVLATIISSEASKTLWLKIGIAIARYRKQGVKFMSFLDIPRGAGQEEEYSKLEQREQEDLRARARQSLEPLKAILEGEKDISYSGEGIARSDVSMGILDMVRRDNADVLIMPLEQLRRGRRGFVMADLQHVLREVRCDLVIVKIGQDAVIPKRILVPFTQNPHNRLLEETARAFEYTFGARATFAQVTTNDNRGKQLGDTADVVLLKPISSNVVSTLVEAGKEYDMILMAASKGGSLEEIDLGETVEGVMAQSNKTIVVVHHHQEIIDPILAPFVALYRKGKKYFWVGAQ
jgi:amino acid transporter/nucleotide-binding universal stress UspA family protein